ncbi:cation transporter [Anaerofilum sp. BX8]|uniref:Cation transporter n=1 Tax=Anaerofilum hominis TaxID=2763016 RepID=A0A923IBQ5_9FIRM|nr:cation diffusion facilitator family transporter [Anaerofilum hominis]MBC5582043.1 cation transporter [Anaerofilum hominis]
MEQRDSERLTMRVSGWSIAINLALSIFKFFAGAAAHSEAMMSDAAHSASDVLSTLAVMVGVKLAHRAPDATHPYGHERFECVASLLLAAALALTGLGIGASALQRVWGPQAALPVPGRLALAAALLSIAVKEGMYRVTRAAAQKNGSSALMADAWHHRSDALSSVGSFAGILGARLGAPVLDPLAGVLICGLIVKAAVEVFRDAVGRMTDRACPQEEQQKMRDAVGAQPGVLGVDRLTTRLFGDRVYVDVEIRADAYAPLAEAHAVAQRVHDRVETRFPQVKHCMVHVNPEPGRTDLEEKT